MSEAHRRGGVKSTVRKRILIGVAAYVVLLALVLVPWTYVHAHAARKAFASFSSSLVSGDLDAAYMELSPETQMRVTLGEFRDQQLDLRRRYGKLIKIEQVGVSVSGAGWPPTWRAAITTDQMYGNETLRFTYHLREKGGRWSVWSYQSDD